MAGHLPGVLHPAPYHLTGVTFRLSPWNKLLLSPLDLDSFCMIRQEADLTTLASVCTAFVQPLHCKLNN